MKALLLAAGGFLAVTLALLAACLVLGGPAEPEQPSAIVAAFEEADIQPAPLARYTARDGVELGYRHTPARTPARGSVVLVHGSAAHSASMQPLAAAFADAGLNVYAPDIRGHGVRSGVSGRYGRIAYVGQLENDLADFIAAVQPPSPRLLAGFSAGGGFALRVAAGAQAATFDGYLLLAPFISQAAPSYRSNGGEWVRVGVPRLLALHLLDSLGIRIFHGLPVMRFAIGDAPELAPDYGVFLAQNFRPRADWRAEIAAVEQPMRVLVGNEDGVFVPEAFADIFGRAQAIDVPVRRLPGIDHAGLVLDRRAHAAAIEAAEAVLTGLPEAPRFPESEELP